MRCNYVSRTLLELFITPEVAECVKLIDLNDSRLNEVQHKVLQVTSENCVEIIKKKLHLRRKTTGITVIAPSSLLSRTIGNFPRYLKVIINVFAVSALHEFPQAMEGSPKLHFLVAS